MNFVALGELKSEFFHTRALEGDMSGDGVVNFVDLDLVKAGFFLRPEPAAPGNVCDQ